MTREHFKARTKAYALRIIKAVEALPRDNVSRTLGAQLFRAAKSQADFISKMGTVEEERDESLFWMDLLIESGRMKRTRLASLVSEGTEILAMTVASIKTARRGL